MFSKLGVTAWLPQLIYWGREQRCPDTVTVQNGPEGTRRYERACKGGTNTGSWNVLRQMAALEVRTVNCAVTSHGLQRVQAWIKASA